MERHVLTSSQDSLKGVSSLSMLNTEIDIIDESSLYKIISFTLDSYIRTILLCLNIYIPMLIPFLII